MELNKESNSMYVTAVDLDLFAADRLIGFSSISCKEEVEYIFGVKIKEVNWGVFDSVNKVLMPSLISSANLHDIENLNFHDFKGKYRHYVNEQVEFIIKNKVTHYFCDNLYIATLLSQETGGQPQIFFFDGKDINKISSSKELQINNLLN